VSATDAGREVASQAPSPLQKTLADALGALPELEQATITLSLERIVSLMEHPGSDTSPILDINASDTSPESGLAV